MDRTLKNNHGFVYEIMMMDLSMTAKFLNELNDTSKIGLLIEGSRNEDQNPLQSRRTKEEPQFDNREVIDTGFYVTEKCSGCKQCKAVCPQNCIDVSTRPAVIRQENCLLCGRCLEICPKKAIHRL